MRTLPLSLVLIGAGPAAFAQGMNSPWEVETSLDMTVVAAAPGEDEASLPDQNGLWETSLGVAAEQTLSSGITIGGRFVVRGARDNPARPAGTGNLGLAGMQGPAGAWSQVALGPQFADQRARASLETAYLFVETGYGEFSFGRDTGVAARFQEGDVSALGSARLVDPYLDTSGLAVISTRPDVTGPSHKFTYTSPRLLGVRAGLSYTPEADIRGLDKDATGDPRAGRAGLENVVELGLNASRRLRESGVRLRAGLGYVTGEVDAPFGFEADFDDRMDVVFAGGEVEWSDHYRFGVNWLSADESLSAGGDYSAWSAGFGYQRGDWDASLVWGQAELDSLGGDSEGISVALRRAISESVAISVAYQDRSLDLAGYPGQTAMPYTQSRDGIVMEITLSLEK